MSYADKVFIDMTNDILQNGTDTKGEKVRPHWEDGTEAYTIKRFGVINRYDLRKEFPILTLRKTGVKSATDELLWIWQKKSNKVSELNSHIWDQWKGEDGTIGKAYGYQLSIKHKYKEGMFDQVDRVLYDLQNNPFSRRIMTNLYNFQDLHEMNLYPCAYSMTFNVTKENDKLVLNGILNQRSIGFIAGELIHVIADCHIYDRHIPIIKEMIKREPLPAPKVYLNPDVKNFYDFTVDDVIVENYVTHEQIKNIPVAI